MASTSKRGRGVERVRTGYHVWALALLLCPLSYISLLIARYFAATGLLATVLVMLFVLTFALSTRDGRTEAKVWQGCLLALAVGWVVGSVAHSFEGADLPSAFLVGLGTAAQLAFFYIFYTWMTAELAGMQIEAGDLSHAPRHAHAPSQASLGFLWFFALLLYGLGAAWSRGDSRTPDPSFWVVAQLLLTLGLMLLERLGFFERSAHEGNLSLAYRAHRTWVGGALLLLLLAALIAGLGPRRTAPPDQGRTGGDRNTHSSGRAASQPFPLEQELKDAGAALSAAAAGAKSASGREAALWLLLLLVLLALLLVWAFSRSRAARWLLAKMSALLARLLLLWRRFLAWLRGWPAAYLDRQAPAAPPPPWVRDPLFDVFEHPDLLAVLSPREVLLRTYHLLLNYGDMLGLGRRPGQTPLEFARFLALRGAAEQALQALTWGYAGALYADTEAPVPAVETVRMAWREVAAALVSRYAPEELATRRAAYVRAAKA